jgi:error-prone DNA polymerase
MSNKGINGETQDAIVQSITSFALYGFPESHSASFALIAYASAYLKCHYLAAFTTAMLNNQPMGFYQPATLVKDAQRHGLKVKPIDALLSDWECTIENVPDGFAMRVGMRYVRGLRETVAREIMRERKLSEFESIDDLKRRIPEIQKGELAALAAIGALNSLPGKKGFHRRDALWQVERAARRPGPLLENQNIAEDANVAENSPLPSMTATERLVADFQGTGMTVGPHPMAYYRKELKQRKVRTAAEITTLPHGTHVRIAGAVIARQRPGTAKGFVFLSLEDETGIANAIVTPQLFDRDHSALVHHPFLLIEGQLQNQENVISVKAERIEPIEMTPANVASHDFH